MAVTDDYLNQLKKLLPQGIAWNTGADSNLSKLLRALAEELTRVDNRGFQLTIEVNPGRTTEMITDWEELVGLPDDCLGELAPTLPERREDVLAVLRATGGQTAQYFISLAAAAGYDITVTTFEPFRVSQNAVGDPLYGAEWMFVWQVNSALNTIKYFKVNENAVGDPLATWGNDALECLIEKYKPAHTLVLYSYN